MLKIQAQQTTLLVFLLISLLLPIAINAQTRVFFLPHDYNGFFASKNPNIKIKGTSKFSHEVTQKTKRVTHSTSLEKIICDGQNPLTGLDYIRAYAGTNTCENMTVTNTTHQLSDTIEFVLLIDDTQPLSAYLNDLLTDQNVLIKKFGEYQISPSLLEFQGVDESLKMLVVGEQSFRDIGTIVDQEQIWFNSIQQLSVKNTDSQFALRAAPLIVSKGNRQGGFKKLYHKCTQEMVEYVKQREFGLDRIGGPELRCINPGPKGYNKWKWYKETKADYSKAKNTPFGRCRIANSPNLSEFSTQEWYTKNKTKYDSSISGHANGRSVDYFTRKNNIGKHIVPTDRELKFGNAFTAWTLKKENWKKFNVKNIIWHGRIYNNYVDLDDESKNPQKYELAKNGKVYSGSKSKPHNDHVHVEYKKDCD